MRIIFFGNGPRGVRCLEALVKNNREIIAVIGHKPNSDVIVCAQNLNIATWYPERINDSDFVARLQDLSPDLLVLAGYNQILHKTIIDMPRLGALNLHGGKLPEYRGVAPINWQIIRGETTGGCCVIFVDEGIDTGDIVERAFYEINENDTAGDLVDKQLKLFPDMLLRAVDAIENKTVKRVQQDADAGAYFTRRYAKDSYLDWTKLTAQEAHNLIRAMQGPGYPPAYCHYNGKTCMLHASLLLKENIQGSPGRIALKRKNGVIVLAKDRGLLLTRIAFEGQTRKNPRRILNTGEDFT